MTGRYAAGGPEAQTEPGSRGRVLQNLRGVTLVREMQHLESEALLETTERWIDETEVDHRFTAADICRMHFDWLGGIYEWAGHYRSVNISKDGFLFAVPAQIDVLMQEFESGPL